MNFAGIDLDSRGSFVVGDENGKLVIYGSLGLPQKPRVGELDFAFRTRRVFALAKVVKTVKRLGVKKVFTEFSDWHRPIFFGAGKAMHMPDLTAAMIIDKQNRTVSRALGFLEGVLLVLCLVRRLEYVPIPVHEAKNITKISGKKSVKKKDVQEAVLSLYPQLRDIESDDYRETLCDATSVLLAGLMRTAPMILMKLEAK